MVLGSFFTAHAFEIPSRPAGYVSDFAEILSSETESALSAQIDEYTQKSSNEIAVVTVPDLSGDSVENIANTLFRQWGIGGKENNNGILFLISRDDRKMRIEVGYGLEGYLTDYTASSIIRNEVAPQFKSGEYDAGVTVGVQKIIDSLLGTPYEPIEKSTINWGNAIFVLLGLLSFLGPLLLRLFLWMFGKSPSWWQGGIAGLGVSGLISALMTSSIASIVQWSIIGIAVGLLIDYLVSKNYSKWKDIDWSSGSGGGYYGSAGGSGGSSFGGFGGGSSGGGGASGDW